MRNKQSSEVAKRDADLVGCNAIRHTNEQGFVAGEKEVRDLLSILQHSVRCTSEAVNSDLVDDLAVWEGVLAIC